MNKAVLISINPKWVELIINGKKTIEVRKTAPKLETPFKVYVYCTKGKPNITIFYNAIEGIKYRANGKVVAEFTCPKIHKIDNKGSQFIINNDIALTNRIGARSRLDFDDMKRYLGTKDGYAWEIESIKCYDEPKELSEFIKPCDFNCNDSCKYAKKEHFLICKKAITRAPQSWCYVDEDGGKI